MAIRHWYKDLVPFGAMVIMECVNVALNTLFKAATLKGMSYHVFVVYAYAVAAFVLLPAPFISQRFIYFIYLKIKLNWFRVLSSKKKKKQDRVEFESLLKVFMYNYVMMSFVFADQEYFPLSVYPYYAKLVFLDWSGTSLIKATQLINYYFKFWIFYFDWSKLQKFISNYGLHRYQLQFSYSLISDKQLGASFYLLACHHFQVPLHFIIILINSYTCAIMS